MTDRSYRVRLEAAVSGFVAGFKQAERSVDQFLTKADQASQHIDRIGGASTKVGLVAAAGLGLAAKAAIDWESQWAGVAKTVDGTTGQLADLEGQLRGMAKTLPATHQEIAAVAEAAGQLGVRREDIASFTKVMIDLGETTNLTSDEASESLAQFMNVMGTAPKDVGQLGASIVALGNDGASTERDIVSMAQRISGSGKIIGLSETQVLGYASALANVGIEAEAGGSAISSIFTRIDKAVSEGGQKLTDFATVSGVTAAQFKQRFETDAAGATQAFIEGLGRMNEAGGDVNATLEALGITEIRQRDAVLRLAASGTNLADSLKTSADGWRENTALVEEAAKRYATTEAQISIAWNNIKDAAITAGAEMLPVIADIAKKVAGIASAFGELPAPVKSSSIALLGIVAAGGLVVGAIAKIVTSIAGAKAAMTALGVTTGRTGATLSAFSKAGAVGAAILGLYALTDAMDKAFGNVPTGNLSQLATDLDNFGKTSVASGALAARFGESLDGVTRRGPDLKGLGETFKAALGADIPQLDGNAKSVKAIDEALASLVSSGNITGAAAAFDQIAAAAARQGLTIEEVQSLLPGYISNLGTAQASAAAAGEGGEKGAEGNKALATGLDSAAESAQKAENALKGYIAALFLMPNLTLGVRDAQRGVQAAMDDATASIKENGKTLKIGSEEGRANQAALDAIATSANKLSEAYLNQGASQKTMTANVVASRQAFVTAAVGMGMTEAAAKALAEQVIAIPDKKATVVSNNAGGKPLTDAKTYAEVLQGTLPTIKTVVTTNAGAEPKTAAQRYAEILQGTLPTVKTSVTNTAPVAKEKMDQYRTALGLTPTSKSTAISTPGATQSQSQVGGLLGLLGSLPSSKSITINTYRNMIETRTVKTVGVLAPPQADGGFYPGGVPSYADGKMPDQAMIQQAVPGGIFQWAEPETKGEAFIPLAPEKRGRSVQILAQVAKAFGLDLVQSFANGGFSLPGGRLVDIAFLLQQMGAAFNPTAGADYTSTLKVQNRANRAVLPARDAALKADRAELAAKAQVASIQRAITLQQRLIAAARAGNPKTAKGQAAEDARVKREQRDLIALQDQLYGAKKRVTAATVASNKADAVYKARADAAKKATEAHAASVEKLIEQQKAAVQYAEGIATGLTSGANIGDLFQKSLTGKGLLADLQSEGADLKKFGSLITQLRAKKLDEGLIQQIIGKGADQGGELAQAILAGGLGLVASLNKAQAALDAQANLIGAGSAAVKYGVKVAGTRAGGGDVAAYRDYLVGEEGPEILRMGAQSGWITPNEAIDPNRYVRSSPGGWGAGQTSMIREVHNHQTIVNNGVSMAEADLIASRAQAKLELMSRGY